MIKMDTLILAVFVFLLLLTLGLTARNEYRAGSVNPGKGKLRNVVRQDTHRLYSLLLPHL